MKKEENKGIRSNQRKRRGKGKLGEYTRVSKVLLVTVMILPDAVC